MSDGQGDRGGVREFQLESLEQRRLLSAGHLVHGAPSECTTTVEGGVLTIRGTAGDESFWVDFESSGGQACVNVVSSRGGNTSVPIDQITGVRVLGNGGIDKVTVDGNTGSVPVVLTDAYGDRTVSGNGPYLLGESDPAQRGQVGVTASVVNGVLVVRGTDAMDEILVGIEAGGTQVFIQSDRQYMDFDLAGLKGIYVDGGKGDDSLAVDNWHGALDLPVTLNGGSGNDLLDGPSGRGRADEWTVTPAQFGQLRTTLLGGDGDDTLIGGVGPDQFDGGAGNDVYYSGNPGGGFDPGDTFAPQRHKHQSAPEDQAGTPSFAPVVMPLPGRSDTATTQNLFASASTARDPWEV